MDTPKRSPVDTSFDGEASIAVALAMVTGSLEMTEKEIAELHREAMIHRSEGAEAVREARQFVGYALSGLRRATKTMTPPAPRAETNVVDLPRNEVS